MDLKVDVRVCRPETRDGTRQQCRSDRGQGRDDNAPGPPLDEACQLSECTIELREKPLGDGAELPARGRELHAPSGAVEQASPDCVLQLLDCPAKGRLRDAVKLCSLAEISGVGEVDKGRKLLQ